MKVVGIYKTSSSSSMPGSDPSNTIYTSYTLPASINGKENKASTVTYTLSNSKKSKATIKQIKSIISDSDFSVTSDDSTYQSLLQPMKNVKAFASKIVWLVAAAGTIILALIIILSVRSRRREIGILVSLGESKSKIVAQLFSELFIIMIASLVVASLFGNIVVIRLVTNSGTAKFLSNNVNEYGHLNWWTRRWWSGTGTWWHWWRRQNGSSRNEPRNNFNV